MASTATVVGPNLTAPGIDPSFGPLLREVDMTIRKQHRGSVPPVEHANAYASSSSPAGNQPSPRHGELELETPEEPDYAEARDERRSPAAVLGSKRLGLVVLPDQLAEAVQNEINGGYPPLTTSLIRTLCPRHPLSSTTVVACFFISEI
jgi:hypothetical protein